MSNYDTGLTFGQAAAMEKERIKHALEGEKCVGEDDDGFIWEPCSDEDADNEILSVFDECVLKALDAIHEAKAYRKIASDLGYDGDSHTMQAAFDATESVCDYVFEGDQNGE